MTLGPIPDERFSNSRGLICREMPGVFQFDNESDWRVIHLFFRLMKLGCFVQHCVILQLTARKQESFWLSILGK